MLPSALVEYLSQRPAALGRVLAVSADAWQRPSRSSTTFGGHDAKKARIDDDPFDWPGMLREMRENEIMGYIAKEAGRDDEFFITLLHLAMASKETYAFLVPRLQEVSRRVDMTSTVSRCMYRYFDAPHARAIYLSYLKQAMPALHAAWTRLIDSPIYARWLLSLLPPMVESGAIHAIEDLHPYNALCLIMSDRPKWNAEEERAYAQLVSGIYSVAYATASAPEETVQESDARTDLILLNALRVTVTRLPLVEPTRALSDGLHRHYQRMFERDRPVRRVPYLYAYWKHALDAAAANDTAVNSLFVYFYTDNWIEHDQTHYIFDAMIVHLAHMFMVILDTHGAQLDDALADTIARIVDPFLDGGDADAAGTESARPSVLFWALLPLAYKRGFPSHAIRHLVASILPDVTDGDLSVALELAVRYNDQETLEEYLVLLEQPLTDARYWVDAFPGLFHRKFLKHGEDAQVALFAMIVKPPMLADLHRIDMVISYGADLNSRGCISPRLLEQLLKWRATNNAPSVGIFEYVKSLVANWFVQRAENVPLAREALAAVYDKEHIDEHLFTAFLRTSPHSTAFAKEVYQTLELDADFKKTAQSSIAPRNVDMLAMRHGADWNSACFFYALKVAQSPLRVIGHARANLNTAEFDHFVQKAIEHLAPGWSQWDPFLYQRVMDELLFHDTRTRRESGTEQQHTFRMPIPVLFEPLNAVRFSLGDAPAARRLSIEPPVLMIDNMTAAERLRRDLALFDSSDEDDNVDATANAAGDDAMDIDMSEDED